MMTADRMGTTKLLWLAADLTERSAEIAKTLLRHPYNPGYSTNDIEMAQSIIDAMLKVANPHRYSTQGVEK